MFNRVEERALNPLSDDFNDFSIFGNDNVSIIFNCKNDS